ncbi:RNA polymerase II elongation factor [Saitozyma podzolica]|uniref:Transcription elongation factor n=1 Tax=Saitozyma podzolica TaxID=1890683 RepID=A0A427YVQ0_9TREE|nr:RNA polymerase II elongation factor [Saitozyma podzolica]
MDAPTLTALVKELNEANAAGKTEKEVKASEELLRTSRAGLAVGKLRTHASPGVSSLAKELVKAWKEVVEENKRKRKRDDGEVKTEDGKRVKAEGSSAAASPAATSTPDGKDKDVKPKSAVKSEAQETGNGQGHGAGAGTASESKPDSAKRESGSPQLQLSLIDSTRTTPRTAKSDGMAGKIRTEDGADNVRDKCAEMMYDALAIDSTAEVKILKERALAIELSTYKQFNYSTSNDYRAKIRSLFLNLKDKGNPGLRNEIVIGHMSAERVASMSKDEMASESVRAMKEKIASDNLFKAKAVGETQAETDAFKCGRCQQRKCTYYQMQTRSADEPMTTFVTCTNCGNRWKFS